MHARSHIRRRLLALSTALSGILATASPALAQQMGGFGTVQSHVGPVSVTVNGTNLDVAATGSGIVNWADFNVGKGSAATFRNGNGNGAPAIAILNRVTGSTPTSIDGGLSSDANVALYMINPNGIAFGPGAQVNLGSLVASTLDVTDADFLDGDDRLTFTSNGNRNAYVSVGGTQIRTEGDLLLLGDSIWSSGSLVAGGDLAAISAGEVTVQAAAGSPLKYAVSRGALQARLYQSGEAVGRNVVLGAVGAAGVVDGLLEAHAFVAATGVAATDHGITIFAGNEVSSPVVSVDTRQSARIDINNTGQVRSARDLIIAGNRNVDVDTLSASGAITVGSRGITETNAAFGEEITLTGLYAYAGDLFASKSIAVYGSEVASISGDVETYNFVASGKAIVLGDDADTETIKASYIQANAGTGGVTGGAGLTLSSPIDTIFTTNGGVSFDPSARIVSGHSLVFGGAATQRVTLADVDVGAISGLEQWQADVTFGNLKVGSDLLIATTDDLRADTITSSGSMRLEGARMEFGGDLLGEGDLAVTGKVLTGQNVTSRSGDVRIETAAGATVGGVSGREVSISADTGGLVADDIRAGKSIFMNADGGGAVTLGSLHAAENILLLADGQLNADDLIGGNDVVAAAAEALVGDVRAEAGSVQIDAFAGSLTAGNVLAGGGVQLNGPAEGAGSGVVSVGAVSAGENVQIVSDSLRLDHDLTGQAVWISVDDGASILLNGNLTARSLNLAGGTALQGTGTHLDVGTVSGSLSGTLQLEGENRIGAIRDLSAGSLALTNNAGWMEIVGSNRFSGDARIETMGDVQFGGGAELAGQHVSLSVGGRFANGAGAGAITAAKNWAVYLSAPDGHAFGGLDSGNRAVWGSDATNTPVEDLGGNRYVFAARPTLTFASQDASKTYGTDAAAIVADSYKVTGLHQGVAGAFRGDLLADVVQGNPLLRSSGSDIRAGVAGGPYRIDIARGSLVATGGYELAFESKGSLTVLAKLLSATTTVSDKIYDGSDVASGTIAIGGVLFGDEVTASGAFRFADKHAGLGKVVTTSAIILEGADAANYSVEAPAAAVADILRKSVQVTMVADDKIYDGTAFAVGRVGAIDGLVAGDDVVLSSGSFQFSDKNAGSAKTVSVSDLRFGGADASNYDFVVPSVAIADILRKDLLVGVVADSKTYDGGTEAAGRITTTKGLIAGDDVSVDAGTFAFADKNAGVGKQVLVSGLTLGGADSGNYNMVAPASATADILRKDLVIAVAADSKTYDGSTAASGRIIGTDGLVAGDSVSVGGGAFAFADKNAGVGKQVLVSGLALGGADSGNYNMVAPASATADILRKDLVIAVAADSKTYDGSTAASGRITGTDGLVASDSVSVGGGAFAFADKNAGVGKQVLVSGLALGGTDSGNYNLVAPASATADILRKDILIAVAADAKTYDGSTRASGRITGTEGIVAGDAISFTSGSFAFADKNAGESKEVLVTGIAIGGSDAGNYNLVVPERTAATIARQVLHVGIAVDDKVYDGNAQANGRVAALEGLVAGDQVVVGEGRYAFSDAHAGRDKQIFVSDLTAQGSDAGNYVLAVAPAITADIFKRAISVRADDVHAAWYAPATPLSFSIVSGSLVDGDGFTGGLQRDPGSVPGTYRIHQGTLALSDDYDLHVQPGTFTIDLDPSAGRSPRLYQEYELGGRAQGLREARHPLFWKATSDCRSSDPETVCP